MTARLPFGTRIHLTAIVKARYLRREKTRTVYDRHPGTGFSVGREVPVDPPRLIDAGTAGMPDPIGEPLPDAPAVPDAGTHRRLRRFPENAHGVVVGWVWRAEGEYHAGRVSGYYEGEEEPAFLAENRRVRLYQIAVDPGFVGNNFTPARVVLAHPDDVRPEVTAAATLTVDPTLIGRTRVGSGAP